MQPITRTVVPGGAGGLFALLPEQEAALEAALNEVDAGSFLSLEALMDALPPSI